MRFSPRLLLLLIGVPSAWAADPAVLDRYVQARLDDHLIRGAALVISRGGQVVHARAYGEAERARAMTLDTPVVIGSLSKAFTATAILQLVEQRRIDLDRPVRTYLPEFKLADDVAAAQITVRELLNQTSGIPASAPRALGDNLTLRDHVLALGATEPSARSGERHIYSSPNYQVLGYLVERVSGMPFGDYLQQRIFDPLEMASSFTEVAAAERAGLAPGHNIWFGLSLPSSYRHEPDRLPTASIITTARDLSRFVAAHAGSGSPILSRESVRMAHQGVGPPGSFKYAMGWREGETAGVKSLWHGGALPSYRAAMVILPETQTSIVLVTNTGSMFADPTREIASGVVSILHSREPAANERPLLLVYLVILLGALLLVGFQVRTFVRSVRAVGPRTSIPRVVALDIALPLAVFVLLPLLTRLPWRSMYESAPDVVAVLVAVLLGSAVTGVVKLARPRQP